MLKKMNCNINYILYILHISYILTMNKSIEDENGMKEVYEECRKLADDFYERIKYEYPTHRDDGEVFINGLYVQQAEKRRNDYYLKCLDERSYRVPKDSKISSKKQKIDE